MMETMKLEPCLEGSGCGPDGTLQSQDTGELVSRISRLLDGILIRLGADPKDRPRGKRAASLEHGRKKTYHFGR
jgi:hypothetical protein